MYSYNYLKRRKGVLDEVISKALYSDEPRNYSISYREFDQARDVKLLEFLKISDSFETIPASRIILVKRKGIILYRSSRPELCKLLK